MKRFLAFTLAILMIGGIPVCSVAAQGSQSASLSLIQNKTREMRYSFKNLQINDIDRGSYLLGNDPAEIKALFVGRATCAATGRKLIYFQKAVEQLNVKDYSVYLLDVDSPMETLIEEAPGLNSLTPGIRISYGESNEYSELFWSVCSLYSDDAVERSILPAMIILDKNCKPLYVAIIGVYFKLFGVSDFIADPHIESDFREVLQPYAAPDADISTHFIDVVSADAAAGSVSGSGYYMSGTPALISAHENDGYDFLEWEVRNSNGERIPPESEHSRWWSDLTLTVQDDVTAVAVFRKKLNNTATEATTPHSFKDVPQDAWFNEGVSVVTQRELMNGTSETLFSPNATASRATIATILWRLSGAPHYQIQCKDFSDVAIDTWYTDAVHWCVGRNIINGYGDESFGPDDPITREQLATILYRYMNATGHSSVMAWVTSLQFKDASKVSDWASTAVGYMVAREILCGKDNNLLDPQGTATRSETATILMRFLEKEDR